MFPKKEVLKTYGKKNVDSQSELATSTLLLGEMYVFFVVHDWKQRTLEKGIQKVSMTRKQKNTRSVLHSIIFNGAVPPFGIDLSNFTSTGPILLTQSIDSVTHWWFFLQRAVFAHAAFVFKYWWLIIERGYSGLSSHLDIKGRCRSTPQNIS